MFLNYYLEMGSIRRVIGVPPLCRGGIDRASLEPSFRLHWPQTCSFVVLRGDISFNHFVWLLRFFLDTRPQVSIARILDLEGIVLLTRLFQPVPAWCAERKHRRREKYDGRNHR